jgi:hypothetical protein
MDIQQLECGHRQPVKPGNGCAWCPVCGTLQVAIPERPRVLARH